MSDEPGDVSEEFEGVEQLMEIWDRARKPALLGMSVTLHDPLIHEILWFDAQDGARIDKPIEGTPGKGYVYAHWFGHRAGEGFEAIMAEALDLVREALVRDHRGTDFWLCRLPTIDASIRWIAVPKDGASE